MERAIHEQDSNSLLCGLIGLHQGSRGPIISTFIQFDNKLLILSMWQAVKLNAGDAGMSKIGRCQPSMI